MHRLCYLATQNLPIIYWRVEMFAQWLFDHRKETDLYPYVEYLIDPNTNIAWEHLICQDTEQAIEIKGKIEAMFKNFDSIIIQRLNYRQGLDFISNLMKQYPEVNIFMEIDDLIGAWNPSNIYSKSITDQDNTAVHQAKISKGIICSTQYLADQTKWINSNVIVIQNCIYPKLFNLQVKKQEENTKESDGTFSIAYIAGGGHDEDLLIAYRGWKLIPDELKPRLVIRYGGFRPNYLEENELIDFQIVDWHISEFPQKISEIGATALIAPLRDTVFNRSKSNIKIIEASEINTPIITSRVGPYKDKEHEKHIIVDNSPESWKNAILQVINTDYSKLISNSFRKEIRKKYCIGKECRKLIRFLIENKNKNDTI